MSFLCLFVHWSSNHTIWRHVITNNIQIADLFPNSQVNFVASCFPNIRTKVFIHCLKNTTVIPWKTQTVFVLFQYKLILPLFCNSCTFELSVLPKKWIGSCLIQLILTLSFNVAFQSALVKITSIALKSFSYHDDYRHVMRYGLSRPIVRTEQMHTKNIQIAFVR